jgi:hypothetical protein
MDFIRLPEIAIYIQQCWEDLNEKYRKATIIKVGGRYCSIDITFSLVFRVLDVQSSFTVRTNQEWNALTDTVELRT